MQKERCNKHARQGILIEWERQGVHSCPLCWAQDLLAAIMRTAEVEIDWEEHEKRVRETVKTQLIKLGLMRE